MLGLSMSFERRGNIVARLAEHFDRMSADGVIVPVTTTDRFTSGSAWYPKSSELREAGCQLILLLSTSTVTTFSIAVVSNLHLLPGSNWVLAEMPTDVAPYNTTQVKELDRVRRLIIRTLELAQGHPVI